MIDVLYIRYDEHKDKFISITDKNKIYDDSLFSEHYDKKINFFSNINLCEKIPKGNHIIILGISDVEKVKEYIWNSKSLLNNLRQNKCRLFIMYAEGSVNDEGYTNFYDNGLWGLRDKIEKNKIPKNNLVTISPEILINKEQYKDLGFEHFFFNNWMIKIESIKKGLYHPFVKKLYKISQSQLRTSHFYSVNSTKRPHRINLYRFLEQNNLLSKGNITFFSNRTDNTHSLLNDYDIKPIGTDCKVDTKGEDWWINVIRTFSAYFQIVTCSIFDVDENDELPYVFFNEKIFKPIICFQPFIVFGQPKILQSLKEFGFKTFSPFIDESYDDEFDNKKRFQMLENEIKRLCSMSRNEMHKWFWKMDEILKHNYNWLEKISFEHYKEFIGLLKNE